MSSQKVPRLELILWWIFTFQYETEFELDFPPRAAACSGLGVAAV